MKTQILLPTKEAIQTAADFIRCGEIVGMPTETVYGLGANALDDRAVQKIFAAKGRPQDNPLIVHISSLNQLDGLVREFSPLAQKLAARFWSGPFTMVLPKSEHLTTCVTAGLDTVGIRMPSHPVAKALIEACGLPIAAPSANTSGRPSTTTAAHVYHDLNGKIPLILDGGSCGVGVESTVVQVKQDEVILLRPGEITLEQLREVCPNVRVADGVIHHVADGERVLSPGMKYKHYSPKVKVVIVDSDYASYRRYLEEQGKTQTLAAMVFDGEGADLRVPCISYGAQNDADSQAQHLFDTLRELDNLQVEVVYARMPRTDGVGFAVYNRLLRAAAFCVVKLGGNV